MNIETIYRPEKEFTLDFLQILLTRNYVDENTISRNFQLLKNHYNDYQKKVKFENFEEVIKKYNKKLNLLGFEIDSHICEITGISFYSFQLTLFENNFCCGDDENLQKKMISLIYKRSGFSLNDGEAITLIIKSFMENDFILEIEESEDLFDNKKKEVVFLKREVNLAHEEEEEKEEEEEESFIEKDIEESRKRIKRQKTKTEQEKIVFDSKIFAKLYENKFVEISKNNQYLIATPRFFMEFKLKLTELAVQSEEAAKLDLSKTENVLKKCILCNQTVFYYLKCKKVGCGAIFHFNCLHKWKEETDTFETLETVETIDTIKIEDEKEINLDLNEDENLSNKNDDCLKEDMEDTKNSGIIEERKNADDSNYDNKYKTNRSINKRKLFGRRKNNIICANSKIDQHEFVNSETSNLYSLSL